MLWSNNSEIVYRRQGMTGKRARVMLVQTSVALVPGPALPPHPGRDSKAYQHWRDQMLGAFKPAR